MKSAAWPFGEGFSVQTLDGYLRDIEPRYIKEMWNDVVEYNAIEEGIPGGTPLARMDIPIAPTYLLRHVESREPLVLFTDPDDVRSIFERTVGYSRMTRKEARMNMMRLVAHKGSLGAIGSNIVTFRFLSRDKCRYVNGVMQWGFSNYWSNLVSLFYACMGVERFRET